MNISLLLIATNKYKKFVRPLIDGIKKYFLNNHQVNVHLFIDEIGEYTEDERVAIKQYIIPSYGYPDATLRRYEIFTSLPQEQYGDYIIYLDVDMAIVDYVGDEILKPILAIYHPGYYISGGWGDTETIESSRGYTPLSLRRRYCAGGFQGGIKEAYYPAMKAMANRIEADTKDGIMARWHDESHWNRFLASCGYDNLSPLSSSYCMPEAQWKRKAWGITQFKPIILALEKEEDIRE